MNVEIITIISNNYGNRLQNYALQEFLIKEGVHVVTSRTDAPHHPFLRKIKFRLCELRGQTAEDLFLRFDRNIIWKDDYFSQTYNDPKIDFYIAGSDQIWNPFFKFNSEREFLTFTDKKKRIAYAASIGLKQLPNQFHKSYRRYLNGFPVISVREKSAADIIYRLTKRRVPVVVDPTMLLSKENWIKVAKKSRLQPKTNYLLKYFLGKKKFAYDTYIERLCQKYNWTVVDLSQRTDRIPLRIGPAEFLGLIAHSSYICTDSFHGIIFSILFEKSFLAFNRPDEVGFGDMSSRVETLLSKFRLSDYYIHNEYDLHKEYGKIDYTKIKPVLREAIDQSVSFLKSAIKLQEI